MAARRREAFTARLLAWGRANRRDFPWRHERDPFRLLVAEVLLQRSRSRTVEKTYRELFSRWPTVGELARASLPEVRAVIQPVGLVSRAATLVALANHVSRVGSVPRSIDELVKLPGVGRYAASATAAAAFGTGEPVVDGVSARVYRRYFRLAADHDPSRDNALWEVLREVARTSDNRALNWAALDLAASVCLPKVPRCSGCPLHAGCAWAAEHVTAPG